MADAAAVRSLPCNIEAERAALASMLHDHETLILGLELLRDLDESAKREQIERSGRKGKGDGGSVATLFFHTPHQLLFDIISDLEGRNLKPDFTTLLDETRSRQLLDKIGGPSALMEIVSSAATGSNLRQYIEIVKEKYFKRRLILSTNEVLERAFEDREDSETILNQAEHDLHQISDKRHSGAFVRIGELLSEVETGLMEAYQKKGLVTGVQTHFTMLDDMTSGLQATDLIILAARPSVGKTSFALNVMENIAVKSKRPVGLFSLEMSTVQIIQRLLCSMSQVDLKRLRSGHLSKRESSRVFNVLANMYPLPIYVDDTPGISIASMRARSLRLKHKEPDLSLIVVDYLQLMEANPGRGGQRNRQEEVSAISRGLKGLARELRVPILALSQLSRGVESREDNLPRLSDLRESGAIEQDADVVLFIHRKRPKKDDEEELDVRAEIIIGKQRNGPIGTVPVAFIANYASFRNMTSVDGEPPAGVGTDEEAYEAAEFDDSVPF